MLYVCSLEQIVCILVLIVCMSGGEANQLERENNVLESAVDLTISPCNSFNLGCLPFQATLLEVFMFRTVLSSW